MKRFVNATKKFITSFLRLIGINLEVSLQIGNLRMELGEEEQEGARLSDELTKESIAHADMYAAARSKQEGKEDSK